MKRTVLALILGAFVAAPAAAQLAGMPVWNSPKGGTGVTVNADFGKPNTDAGGGSAFGARASIGLANLTVGAGLSSWKPDGAPSRSTSLAGNLALKVIPGTMVLPLTVNVQAGVGRLSDADLTVLTAAVGVGYSPPTPGVNLEIWASPGLRYSKVTGGGSSTDFGFAIGANLTFGMMGVHAAYDYTKQDVGSPGILGVGVHVSIKPPIPGPM